MNHTVDPQAGLGQLWKCPQNVARRARTTTPIKSFSNVAKGVSQDAQLASQGMQSRRDSQVRCRKWPPHRATDAESDELAKGQARRDEVKKGTESVLGLIRLELSEVELSLWERDSVE